MKTNFSMLFYMKKQKNYKAGSAPIYVRITVDGKRSDLATGRDCLLAKWNTKSGRVVGMKEDIRSFNAFLDALQFWVYDAHQLLYEAGEAITPEAIKNKVTWQGEACCMLIEILKEHSEKVKTLVKKEFAPGTLTRYETSLKHTVEFLTYKYGITDIDIRRIIHSFVAEYDFYLRSLRGCANNSAVKYLKNFGKIIRICLSNGWITANPFSNSKGKLKTVTAFFFQK